jgi:copper chaperone CopZ
MHNTNPRTITITGMTGDDCVQKVRAALRNVSGVTTENVTVGQATITCGYAAAYGSACTAITSAGFRVIDLATDLNAAAASTPVTEPVAGAAPVNNGGHQTDDMEADVIGSIGDIKPLDQKAEAPVATGSEPKEAVAIAV